MIYVFLGPPGSGKSTQARLLQETLAYDYVKVSDLLRKESRSDTEIAQVMNSGDLVPSTLIERVLAKYQQTHRDNVIIDGAFRRPTQVDKVVRLWQTAQVVVILLELDKETVRNRLNHRHEGRPDDAPQIIEHRLETYAKTMKDVLDRVEYNKLPVVIINGNQTVEAIHQELLEKLRIYDHPPKNS